MKITRRQAIAGTIAAVAAGVPGDTEASPRIALRFVPIIFRGDPHVVLRLRCGDFVAVTHARGTWESLTGWRVSNELSALIDKGQPFESVELERIFPFVSTVICEETFGRAFRDRLAIESINCAALTNLPQSA